jgi:hypothetical protein
VSDAERYPSGTADLSDAEFVDAMEGLTLANERFRHYDHLRLAWIFAREATLDAATERMVQAIRRFALHHGGSLDKYHDTMTRAYMRFVAAHIAETPDLRDFAAFAAAHAPLFDRRLPFRYFSEALLMSSDARHHWVEPDLRPLPSLRPAA